MAKNSADWGKDKAKERYGASKSDGMGAPTDQCYPESPNDKMAPGYANNVAPDWRRGMGPGQAEGKPGFMKTPTGKNRGAA